MATFVARSSTTSADDGVGKAARIPEEALEHLIVMSGGAAPHGWPLFYHGATTRPSPVCRTPVGGSPLARSSATAHEVAALFACANEDEFARLEERYADDPRKQVQHAREVAEKAPGARAGRARARPGDVCQGQRARRPRPEVLGVDEVGRGALAGPLTVAAVALPR